MYRAHMSDLRERMVIPLRSRIEQVVRFEHGLDLCHPRAYFVQDRLLELLQQRAIMIPFAAIDGTSLPNIVRQIF